MKALGIVAVASLGVLAACEQDRGVGLGPVGAGGDLTAPQSTRAEFEMVGVAPLPIYRFATNEATEVNPATAITLGGSRLRNADTNLVVEVAGRTYLMRQIELNGANFVVAEGAAPVDSLLLEIRTRTGCLVQTPPLQSGDAAVYTLDCS